MAELLHLDRRFWNYANQEISPPQEQTVMRLYCWPCRTVHSFPVADVEKIVYALGASEWDGWNDNHIPSGAEHPTCLRTVLRYADNPEVYAEHVEQGVECREKTPNA